MRVVQGKRARRGTSVQVGKSWPEESTNGADTEYFGHVYDIYSVPFVMGTSVLLRVL